MQIGVSAEISRPVEAVWDFYAAAPKHTGESRPGERMLL
jgi:hypothetical protein